MSTPIRDAFERVESLLERSPERGLGTGVSRVRLVDGASLACDIEEGPWTLSADMPENTGGGGTAPTPGVYGRAALGSCLAITYAMWAAKRSITLKRLEVEVHADFDSGALFGVSDTPPGYTEVRLVVTIESDASADTIESMLDEADRHSPYVDVFARAHKLERSVRFVK